MSGHGVNRQNVALTQLRMWFPGNIPQARPAVRDRTSGYFRHSQCGTPRQANPGTVPGTGLEVLLPARRGYRGRQHGSSGSGRPVNGPVGSARDAGDRCRPYPTRIVPVGIRIRVGIRVRVRVGMRGCTDPLRHADPAAVPARTQSGRHDRAASTASSPSCLPPFHHAMHSARADPAQAGH
jgi:hypothetical protein